MLRALRAIKGPHYWIRGKKGREQTKEILPPTIIYQTRGSCQTTLLVSTYYAGRFGRFCRQCLDPKWPANLPTMISNRAQCHRQLGVVSVLVVVRRSRPFLRLWQGR